MYLQKILTKKKKEKASKKQLKVAQRLVIIPEEIIERVLKMYMNRQKYYFTIRFLQWLITYRGEGYELDQIQDMESDINTWSSYMHDIDTILFGNQEWIPMLMPEHI